MVCLDSPPHNNPLPSLDQIQFFIGKSPRLEVSSYSSCPSSRHCLRQPLLRQPLDDRQLAQIMLAFQKPLHLVDRRFHSKAGADIAPEVTGPSVTVCNREYQPRSPP